MKFLIVSAVLAAATISSSSIVKSSSDGNFELLILHNNDMHARFEQTSQLSGICTTADREAGKCYGGFPRVAHVVKEARKAAAAGTGPPVLYLNAGDTYTGTAWFTLYKWEIAAEFVNALKPDAVSLGNHEFDLGVAGLTPFIHDLECPVLTANLILTKVPELAAEPNLMNSIVFNVSGIDVGVIGYLTPTTKNSSKKNDVEYEDEIIALKREVANLKKGVNIIIALGHSGYERDLEIAQQVEDLDLVIGGHSHTFLGNGSSPDKEIPLGPYPTYVTQASGRSVPVVQAYAFNKYMGKIHMIFNSKGEIISLNGSPILLDQSIPQDPEILIILDRYRDQVQNVSDEIIGSTSVVLDHLSCEKSECNLGNLITDAMVYKYASHYNGEHWTDAPIATIQAGGIRTSISHIERPMIITKGDLLNVMPFKGYLAAVSMNGSVLVQMLEHSVGSDAVKTEEYLQFSGIKVLYNMSNPIGSRVVAVTARCWACDVPSYIEVQDKQIYKVIMPDFMSNGGDGYSMLTNLPTETLPYNELLCTQEYIRQHSPVFPEIEGRITKLKDVLKDSAHRTSLSFTVALLSALGKSLS